MEFEFDAAKSKVNAEKHGIDFAAAQEMWQVPGWVQPLPHLSEPRLMRVAPCQGKLWMAVYTMRNGLVRLISVRRARQYEVRNYERHIAGNAPDPQS